MTASQSSRRLAYDDAATLQEMHSDCRAVGSNLRLERVGRAAMAPAPSIHYDEYPRELPKREISVTEAAATLAAALHLHLD